MNYFDKIRSLNNLQLCHFLNGIQGNLELVALALDRASNPDIYCSDDDFCIGTPKKFSENTVYWHDCLRKDFDKAMEEIFAKDKDIREQIRGWKNSDKQEG